MAEAFAAVRPELDPPGSVPDPWPDSACLPEQTKRAGAAASTYDAVLYALRHGGETALARQTERLSEFSVGQLESLIVALKRLGACENLLLSLAELLP
jgi:hypothetical protein